MFPTLTCLRRPTVRWLPRANGCRRVLIYLLGTLCLGYVRLAAAQPGANPPPPPTVKAAAQNGDLEALQVIQRALPAALDQVDSQGWTPLMHAIDHHHRQVALWLIAAGVKLDARAWDGWTALEVAMQRHDWPVVTALLDKGVRADAPTANHGTLLTEYGRSIPLAVLPRVLAAGADPNGAGPNGCTALNTVIGGEAAVERLECYFQHQADPNRWAPGGHSALQEAYTQGDLKVATLLLNHGAEVNAVITVAEYPETCLAHACADNRRDWVDLFLARQAEVNSTAELDTSPWLAAMRENHIELAELLLDHGADPWRVRGLYVLPQFNESQDRRMYEFSRGDSICLAVRQMRTEALAKLFAAWPGALPPDFLDRLLPAAAQSLQNGRVQFVRDLGMDPTHFQQLATKLLIEAAGTGDDLFMRNLVAGGLIVNNGLGTKQTALVEALRAGKPRAIELLLQEGASISPLLIGLQTPPLCAFLELHLGSSRPATLADIRGTVSVLLAAGVRVGPQDPDAAVLIPAVRYADPDLIALLLQAGADPNIADKRGNTPARELYQLCARSYIPPDLAHAKMVQLQAAGLQIQQPRADGLSDMAFILQNPSPQFSPVEFLAASGVDLQARDAHGVTPIVRLNECYADAVAVEIYQVERTPVSGVAGLFTWIGLLLIATVVAILYWWRQTRRLQAVLEPATTAAPGAPNAASAPVQALGWHALPDGHTAFELELRARYRVQHQLWVGLLWLPILGWVLLLPLLWSDPWLNAQRLPGWVPGLLLILGLILRRALHQGSLQLQFLGRILTVGLMIGTVLSMGGMAYDLAFYFPAHEAVEQLAGGGFLLLILVWVELRTWGLHRRLRRLDAARVERLKVAGIGDHDPAEFESAAGWDNQQSP